MPQDELIRAIQFHGARAREARQVESRLWDLLARRLADIRGRLSRECPDVSASELQRRALADAEYVAFLDEWIDVAFQSSRERVEYDTHTMLFEARRSLRALRARR
jgi:hypothetical protein